MSSTSSNNTDLANTIPAKAKNVIFMVADGFGANQILAYEQFKGSAPVWNAGVRGAIKTSSASHLITDSAASATAYAIGEKTYNGAIGVDALGQAQVSVLDIASKAGKATGLVSTASIIDATPAAFASSTASRGNRNEIAQQYIDNGDLDVMLGGGRRYFTVDHDKDGKTTLEEAQDRGFEYVKDAAELSNAGKAGKDKLIGLFTSIGFDAPVGNGALGAYATGLPSLADMTKAALANLSKNENGFFLVVEEEGTDTYGHDNDASTTLHSAASYEKAVEVALEFVKNNPDTLLITTADHETGGMKLNYLSGGSAGNPAIYRNAQATYDKIANDVVDAVDQWFKDNPNTPKAYSAVPADVTRDAVLKATGGAVNLSDAEIERIFNSGLEKARSTLGEILNERGGVSFTTDGHAPDDVPLFAFGAGADLRSGTIDNTEVASWLAEAMGLALPATKTNDVSDAGTGANTLVFRNGLNGYSGIRDTYVAQPKPDTAFGEELSNLIDGPVATPYQTLIRFDDLVGSSVHQIAPDAEITSATIELRVTNAGNAISVHRMLSDWNEQSTWNSLSEGVAVDGVEAAADPDIKTSGKVTTGLLSLDVTAAVKAWQADPTANFGLVIRPTGSDGVDFYSSESVAKVAPVLRVTVDKKNPAPIAGTDGDDDLTGSGRNDVISAGLGDDTVSGGGGKDKIDGGEGDDSLSGNEGDDILLGGAGDDVLDGGAGDDILAGGADDNVLIGGEGIDTADYSFTKTGVTVNLAAGTALGGDLGEDTLSGIENVAGGAGDDRLSGDDKANRLLGAAGADTLNGGAGDDVLDGGEGNDAIDAGAGDDMILASLGDDAIDGGEGFDTLDVSAATGPITLDMAAGKVSGAGIGSDSVRNVENVLLGAGDDVVSGGNGADGFDGGAGNDTLKGLAGNDTLKGSGGDNRLEGGSGDDRLAANAGNDVLKGGSGVDVIDAGAGDDQISGGSGDDVLTGGAGNDAIEGGSGNDRITGGAGNDTLAGGSGLDSFVFAAGFGKDIITGFRTSGASADVLEFGKDVFTDFADAMASAKQAGADTVFSVDADTSLTLKGIELTSLAQDDFRFV